jgi:hypothetical protein
MQAPPNHGYVGGLPGDVVQRFGSAREEQVEEAKKKEDTEITKDHGGHRDRFLG